ncbi:MAG: ATP-binding cassette domain-containing protein, partial [Gammaproteobacteria bacterium]|nr:ATP-binding cassette domain-containing protein [Gammaproteobacteria bacterium]
MHDGSVESPILRARAINKTVPTAEGDLCILDGVDFQAGAGESVAVVGASGSGKTTLLGILAGLDLPTDGDVWLDGEEITGMSEERRARVRGRCIGFVFQTFQ